MTADGATAEGNVVFGARRGELFALLLRGYAMMLITLGIYRFWVATQKRRYYWHDTSLSGQPLEYTGNALQLLLGFLFAVAFFLPVYVTIFYLSTQAAGITVLGYAGLLLLFWYMLGYAAYRGRDFRLSRTLWRGIRFDQRGSAHTFALRRFLWSVLVLITLGLAYPFMAGSLWRYRYTNSWYGDRQFSFSGSWRQLAGPFYRVYFGLLALAVAASFVVMAGPTIELDQGEIPGPVGWLAIAACLVAVLVGWQYYRARSVSRMFSSISIGEARVTVHVRARALLRQAIGYGLAVLGLSLVFALIAGLILATVGTAEIAIDAIPTPDEMQQLLRTGWLELALIALTYLGFLAGLSFCWEMIPGYGFWALVARGATVTNLGSLATVRATREDRALVGEGLADALNVGSY